MPSFRFLPFKHESRNACHCAGGINNHDAENPFDTGYQFTRSERLLQKNCLARLASAPDRISSISSPLAFAVARFDKSGRRASQVEARPASAHLTHKILSIDIPKDCG
jgi:hypothetical protein